MFTDDLLALAALQAVTASAASTNTVDLGTARDIGEGTNLYVDFKVGTTFLASGGASNMTMQIVVSDNADLSSPVVIAQTGAIPKATLVSGYRNALRIPPQIGSLGHRYLGAYFAVDTNNMTAGTISARIVNGIEDGLNKNYPSGFSVL